jgi:hypothetical protein
MAQKQGLFSRCFLAVIRLFWGAVMVLFLGVRLCFFFISLNKKTHQLR